MPVKATLGFLLLTIPASLVKEANCPGVVPATFLKRFSNAS